MSRYLIKFTKEGYLKYTSHLDIMRFFQRTFKRAGIKLLYSQGFNPHPKMSIAQPLSLGYTSTGEYIEIETEAALDQQSMLLELNELMPIGMTITCVKPISQGKKTLAAMVEYGEYEVLIDKEIITDEQTLEKFLQQTKIEVKKLQRKTGIVNTVDIKPLIHSICAKRFDNNIMLTMIIRNGSSANLNPELLLQALMEFLKLKGEPRKVVISRKELYYINNGSITKLEDFKEQ